MLLGDAAVRGYGSGGGWEYDVGICFDGRGDKDGRGYDVIQRYSIWYELIYLFLHYLITINWQGIKIKNQNSNTQ